MIWSVRPMVVAFTSPIYLVVMLVAFASPIHVVKQRPKCHVFHHNWNQIWTSRGGPMWLQLVVIDNLSIHVFLFLMSHFVHELTKRLNLVVVLVVASISNYVIKLICLCRTTIYIKYHKICFVCYQHTRKIFYGVL